MNIKRLENLLNKIVSENLSFDFLDEEYDIYSYLMLDLGDYSVDDLKIYLNCTEDELETWFDFWNGNMGDWIEQCNSANNILFWVEKFNIIFGTNITIVS